LISRIYLNQSRSDNNEEFVSLKLIENVLKEDLQSKIGENLLPNKTQETNQDLSNNILYEISKVI